MVQPVQQLLRILRCAEKPLLQVALLDDGVFMAPAAAVNDLLIGKHRGAERTPVHLALLAEGKAVLQHAQEKPLRPTVVVGQAGGDFGLPVIAEAQAAHLAAHVGYVLERPLAGRGLVFQGSVFGGEPEGIPAHGMEDVVALHPHVAGQGVANGVVADVAHVELA